MKYCTNCGKETTAKICPHCGNNAQKAKNFCGWCGHEVDQNAVMCPNCHERLKESFGAKIRKIVGIAAAVFFLVLAFAFLTQEAYAAAGLYLILAILLLPITKSLIRKATFGSAAKRHILSIVRVIAIVGCFCLSIAVLPESEPIPNKVYKDEATDAALLAFHNEVTLKNEESFVLNDSNVTYVDSYNGNDNLALVTVLLDYSAQNGFGGMNRDTYTVQLIFNYAHGTYRPAD